MVTLTLGLIFILIGVVSISFTELCRSLKENEQGLWRALGSPRGTSFFDLSKTISVYAWVLGGGYERSQCKDVVACGKQAYKRALFAKYTMMWGVLLLVSGFFLWLMGM